MQAFSVGDKCECKCITGNNSLLGKLPYGSDFLVVCTVFETSNLCATFFTQRANSYITRKSVCKMHDYVVLSYGFCGFVNGATNIKHKCESQFVFFYDIIKCCGCA
jgi:hypothetical protein